MINTAHCSFVICQMDQFIVDTTHRAMAQDALSESHPISVEIIDPSEIAANFDDITYNKVLEGISHLITSHAKLTI